MTLNPPSLLLERNAAQFSGSVLFANPEDSYPHQLSQDATVYAWCQSRTVFDFLTRLGMSEDVLHFGHQWDDAKGNEFDHVIIYQPKAKELLDYLLAVTLPLLKQGGSVWLVGDNKSGVKSSMKRLVAPLGEVGKVESAKHCLLFSGRKLGEAKPFIFDQWVKRWEQEVAGHTFTLCSIPGVFGHGKTDKGTALLLEQLAEHRFMSDVANARLLDFGCGDGIISMWLYKHTGAHISALDDSALALKATELTFAANDAKDAVTLISSNGLAQAKGRYNYVITNPPFHTGINTDYSVAERFFIEVKKHLTLNGELFVVANDFLRYPPLIDASLGKHQLAIRTGGFAVYYARQVKN